MSQPKPLPSLQQLRKKFPKPSPSPSYPNSGDTYGVWGCLQCHDDQWRSRYPTGADVVRFFSTHRPDVFGDIDLDKRLAVADLVEVTFDAENEGKFEPAWALLGRLLSVKKVDDLFKKSKAEPPPEPELEPEPEPEEPAPSRRRRAKEIPLDYYEES